METFGQVVKLDRGFPLIRLRDGSLCRGKHATGLVKGEQVRAVIGDEVRIGIPEGVDKAVIEEIMPRRRELVRKDPAERTQPQVMAANFDLMLITQPLAELNIRRLLRELVLAHETGAAVAVLLTKADLAESEEQVAEVRAVVGDIVGDAEVMVLAADDDGTVEQVRKLIGTGCAVLVGRSGVGKSTLVNLLVGSDIQETGAVRDSDGKGRHTTVSREMIDLPGGGFVIDMPGVRGLGIWDATEGIASTFPDIVELAAGCRFRDCSHGDEPGCAVRAAVEAGTLAPRRLQAYRDLCDENARSERKRAEAERVRTRRGHPRRRRG